MLVRNAGQPNTEMRLRSNGRMVLSDARGVYEVSREDGDFLLSTGKPWEAYDGPFTRPHPPTTAAEGVVPADVIRQFEDAAQEFRDTERTLRDLLGERDAQIAVLEQRVQDLENRTASGTVPPPAVLTGNEIPPPAAPRGADSKAPPPPDDEEIDLEAMDMDALHALAEKHAVKLDKRWGIEKVRNALAEAIFEEG